MGSTENHAKPTTEVDEEEKACILATQLMVSSSVSLTLKAVVELGVLEIIAKADRELTAREIAALIPTVVQDTSAAAAALDRMLAFLASHAVFACSAAERDRSGSVERRYRLAPAAKYLVRNQDGLSLAPIVLLAQDKVFLDSWQHMKDAVVEGSTPFTKAHGMSAFEYSSGDPRFNKIFNEAMKSHSGMLMNKMLDTYEGFQELTDLVDVAGGIGGTLSMIVSKYPHIKATNFDLPHVISKAPPIPGVEHIGGDMFESVPKAGAILMKWILHNWNDEQCVKILKNCWKSIPDTGKVIVMDQILPEIPENNLVSQNNFYGDICMLMFNTGARERTQKEFEYLGKEAGFSGYKPVCCAYNIWVMEFSK